MIRRLFFDMQINSNPYSEIVDKLRTREDLELLKEEIQLLLVSIYQPGEGGFEKVLKRSVRSWVASSVLEGLLKTGLTQEKYLKGLEEKVAQLRELKLTLSFQPTEEFVDELNAWVIEHLGAGIILDIKVDQKILGGAIITYEGKYRDYSLAKRFDKSFYARKKEIMPFPSQVAELSSPKKEALSASIQLGSKSQGVLGPTSNPKV